MLIASWNVNSLKSRLAHVIQWLKASNPDVLFLQVTSAILKKILFALNVCYQALKSGEATDEIKRQFDEHCQKVHNGSGSVHS
jgi:hypothetical protein